MRVERPHSGNRDRQERNELLKRKRCGKVQSFGSEMHEAGSARLKSA